MQRLGKAAKKAQLSEIPAIVIDGNEVDKVALVENILRQDLTPLEEAEASQRLKEKYKYSNEKLSQVFKKAPNTVDCQIKLTPFLKFLHLKLTPSE